MIAKIKPLPVTYRPGEQSISNSFAQHGWNRHPGSGAGYPPLRHISGRYLTGLDENSPEIQQLMKINSEEGRRMAIAAKERRERLEAATGLDLSPNSIYYSGVYDPEYYGTGRVAEKVKLVDKENVFDFSNPLEEVQFWWVIQNKDLIAPSLTDWKDGKCSWKVQFYIENEAAEAEIAYKRNSARVDADQALTKMSPDVRRKVATLCGLPVTEQDNDMIVYNKLSDFIHGNSIDKTKFKGQNPVEMFNRMANLSKPLLDVKVLVQKAIELRIYTERNGVVYEGSNVIANTQEQLIEQLASGERTQEKLALEIKVNDKMRLRGSIEGVDVLPTVAVPRKQKPADKPAEQQ